MGSAPARTRVDARTLVAVAGVPLSAVGMALAFRGPRHAHWRRLALTQGALGLAALAAGRTSRPPELTRRDLSAAASTGAALFAVGSLMDAWLRRSVPRLGEDAEALRTASSAAGRVRMSACLALVIAPGEELFWRGLVQDLLTQRYGAREAALMVSALYGLAHVATGNSAVTGAATGMGSTLAVLRANGASVERLALTHACWVVPTLLWERARGARPEGRVRSTSTAVPHRAAGGGEDDMTASRPLRHDAPRGRAVNRWGRFAQRVNNTAHVALYERTRGRVGKRMLGNQVGILTTAGRQGGEPYSVPLFTFSDGKDMLVVASYRGSVHNPAWFRNLLADPDAVLRVADRAWPVRARVLEGDERAETWRWLVEGFKGYAAYQRRTSRELPVVRLSPREETG